MEIRKLIFSAVCLALAAGQLCAQSSWRGIRPGVSTRGDVERVAGPPVQAITETLVEYNSTQPGDRAFVQYRSTGVVERAEIVLARPIDRSTALPSLGLSGRGEISKQNARGQTEEYFGAAMMVLTIGANGVERYAYYSRDLFEAVGGSVGASQAGSDIRSPQRTLPEPARADPPAQAAQPEPSSAIGALTIPVATKLEVRLTEKLSTEKNKTGDKFRAALDKPLVVDGIMVADKGAEVEGRITNLLKSGRVKGVGEMHLELTSLRTSDGQMVAISTGGFAQTAESTAGSDTKKVGVATGIGAAIGAIASGGRGAAMGAGAGAAAASAVTLARRGKPAELAVETQIMFQLTLPVTVVTKGRR